jgi:hypothetical protein
MICPKCKYEWSNRATEPKRCPNPKCQHVLFEYPEPNFASPVTETPDFSKPTASAVYDAKTGAVSFEPGAKELTVELD